jgi:hypothetical protein
MIEWTKYHQSQTDFQSTNLGGRTFESFRARQPLRTTTFPNKPTFLVIRRRPEKTEFGVPEPPLAIQSDAFLLQGWCEFTARVPV